MTVISDEPSGKVSLWYDPRVRSIVSQVILIALLGWAFWAIVDNTIHNMQRLKIASGFGFLSTEAGFAMAQSLIEFNEKSSYLRAFESGLVNTLYVSILGIILATILGFLTGVARLSKNWLISKVATVYVEIMRNIPLLLQIIVWYKVLLAIMPPSKRVYEEILFGLVKVNITGVYVPRLITQPGFWMTGAAIVVGIVCAWLVARWGRKRMEATGQPFPSFWAGLGLIVLIPAIVFIATGKPGYFEMPNFIADGPILRRGFEAGTGFVFGPEFLALLFALTLYTGAFISEIVRAGILSVSHGQTEAAGALGLRHGKILRLVVIPQAMRVIIPPLTSQYLNLTKNSSLAMAIGYMDVMGTGGIVLNQSGQAVEVIVMIMAVYLTLSLLTSLFMNWYNAKMSLVER